MVLRIAGLTVCRLLSLNRFPGESLELLLRYLEVDRHVLCGVGYWDGRQRFIVGMLIKCSDQRFHGNIA